MTLQLLTNKRFISQSGGLLMTMTLMKHLCFGCSLSSFNAAKKHVSNSRKSFKTFLKVLLENVFIVIMAVLLPWSLQRQAYLMQAKHQQMIISKRSEAETTRRPMEGKSVQCPFIDLMQPMAWNIPRRYCSIFRYESFVQNKY